MNKQIESIISSDLGMTIDDIRDSHYINPKLNIGFVSVSIHEKIRKIKFLLNYKRRRNK